MGTLVTHMGEMCWVDGSLVSMGRVYGPLPNVNGSVKTLFSGGVNGSLATVGTGNVNNTPNLLTLKFVLGIGWIVIQV